MSELWRLRVEIVWMRCLLSLVSVRGVTRPRPEIHAFLFDRYFRLAEGLRRIADWHFERSDPDPPPPAAQALSPTTRSRGRAWTRDSS